MLGAMFAFVFQGMALPIGLGVVWILSVANLIINVAAALLDFADELQKLLPGVNAGSLGSALGGGVNRGKKKDRAQARSYLRISVNVLCFSAPAPEASPLSPDPLEHRTHGYQRLHVNLY